MPEFGIICDGIVDGKFKDKYGKRGLVKDGMPVVSPAVKFENAPQGTVSYAIVMEDKDAFGVSGFSWVHWTACNIHSDIEEDASRNNPPFLQGANSWISIQGGRKSPEKSACYGGMAPPDKPHLYELHAYALDCNLKLEKGFLMNNLYHAMRGHVLASATVAGWYSDI